MREAPPPPGQGQPHLSTPAAVGKRRFTAENGRCAYRRGRSLTAGVQLDFSPEDRAGIIGPNGSGKIQPSHLIAADGSRSAASNL